MCSIYTNDLNTTLSLKFMYIYIKVFKLSLLIWTIVDKTGQYRDFVCQLGIQCLEHKYKDVVDKRYKLPKLKYMGATVQSQYIQDRKKMPKIEEVKSEQSLKGPPKGPVSKPIEVVEKDLPFRLQYLQLGSLNSPDCNNSITLQHLEKLLHEYKPEDDEEENSTLKRIPIEVQPTEYTEPTIVPEQSVVAVLLSAEVRLKKLIWFYYMTTWNNISCYPNSSISCYCSCMHVYMYVCMCAST